MMSVMIMLKMGIHVQKFTKDMLENGLFLSYKISTASPDQINMTNLIIYMIRNANLEELQRVVSSFLTIFQTKKD